MHVSVCLCMSVSVHAHACIRLYVCICICPCACVLYQRSCVSIIKVSSACIIPLYVWYVTSYWCLSTDTILKLIKGSMSLIHYSKAPLSLFNFPYTLDLLLQYLPFANGTGGVRKF